VTVQINDILRADAVMEFGGTEDVINAYQFRYVGSGATDDATALDDLADFLDAVYTWIVATINVVVAFKHIRGANITQDTLLGISTWPALTAGTSAGVPTPPGVAPLVEFPTNIPRVTLRKFGAPTSQAFVTAAGVYSTSLTGAYASFVVALLAGYTTGIRSYEYGYLSPKTGTWLVPTVGLVTNVPAYQRRRRQGRGA